MNKTNKKGNMGLKDVPMTAISLVLIAVVLVVGYLILAGMQTSLNVPANLSLATAGQLAANGAVGNLTTAMNNVVTFAPTWGTVIGAAVILAIVFGSLYFFVGRRGDSL